MKKISDYEVGKDFVLYHVKRKLPKDNYYVTGPLVTNPADIESLLGLGLPQTKAEFLAPFFNPEVRVSTYTPEYDYTFAAGYRDDMKALVVVYARPDWTDTVNTTAKEIRRRGFDIACGRIRKAVHDNVVLSDIDNASEALNRHVLDTMLPYCTKAYKFFKDKPIDSLYMYTPDNRLVLIVNDDCV